jgi:hypothetical protein
MNYINIVYNIFNSPRSAKDSLEYNKINLNVTDLEILVVLVTRLLRRDLNRLVNGMEPVEL